ncbi:hypothetical protein GY45DRAFT_1375826 [Cubamyces sp. BRFM 1775]|nr:hypothetical protein GY45DRAFT_1375826 [Cubamyces sp. BRFM 1775]
MRRFLSRSRSVPLPPDWECTGTVPSSPSSSSSVSSDSPPQYSGKIECTAGADDEGRSTAHLPSLPSPYNKFSKLNGDMVPGQDTSCHACSNAIGREIGANISPSRHRSGGIPIDSEPPCCFVVVNQLSHASSGTGGSTSKVIIHDPDLLAACRDLVPDLPDTSSPGPLELDLYVLLGLLPQLEQYRDNLLKGALLQDEQAQTLKAVNALISHLRNEHHTTLARLDAVAFKREVAFDLLPAILVPRTVVISRCTTTGEWRAFRLRSARMVRTASTDVLDLTCESIDVADDSSHCECCSVYGSPVPAPGTHTWGTEGVYGRVKSRFLIPQFSGTANIDSLQVFPIRFHPDVARLEASLIARGKRWLSLQRVHHMQYDGPATRTLSVDGYKTVVRCDVKSYILLDRGSFRRHNPDCDVLAGSDRASEPLQSLTTEEIMLTPPILYGLSLAGQKWLEFNIEHMKPIAGEGDIPSGHTLRDQADAHPSVQSDLDSARDLDGPQHREKASTALPSLEESIYRALAAARAETMSEIQRLCKVEMSVSATNIEERLTRGLSDMNTQYSTELAMHRQLLRLITIASAVFAILAVFLLYRTCIPPTRPTRWAATPTHFTIPILSPFSSVIEHESSLFNVSQLWVVFVTIGLFVALRLWYGIRRK